MSEEKKEQSELPVNEDAELDARLQEEKQRGAEFLTKLNYLQADFENYRRRMEKELREAEDFSAGNLVVKLLGTLDELRLAIEGAEERKENGPLLDGIKMVYKKFSAILEKEGLRPIEAVGQRFNPELHEAVEKSRGGKGEEDIVIDEIRRGYIFRNQVIRPSMVKVEMAARGETREEEGQDE